MAVVVIRKCIYCLGSYPSRSAKARYCGTACKQRHARDKQRTTPPTLQPTIKEESK